MKKEDYKDQGLRQALQRRNEAAEQMTLPEDFTDRLMERLEKAHPYPPKGRENQKPPLLGKTGCCCRLSAHHHWCRPEAAAQRRTGKKSDGGGEKDGTKGKRA